MERTWRIIPFAALAAAVMLAAACSDGSSEDWSKSESKQSAGAGAQDAQDVQGESVESTENVIVTENDVLELIQEIGMIGGTNAVDKMNAYWNFPDAKLIEGEAYVQWIRPQNPSGATPNIWHTRNFLRQRGKVSTELLSVDLSDVDWDKDTEGKPQAAIGEIGKRYMTMTIGPAEGFSGELPKELQAITVAFDSPTDMWIDNASN